MRALSLSLLLAAAPVLAQGPRLPQLTLDYPAMADKIVERLALLPGEKVLLLCQPGKFSEIVPALRYSLAKAGAVDLGCLEVLQEPVPLAWDQGVLAKSAAAAQAMLRTALREVDAAVMLPGAAPRHPAYAAIQDLLRQGGARRTVHFHWDGGGAPSAAALPGQPVPAQPIIDATYQRALLHTDYVGIAAVERQFAQALHAGEVHVTSVLGTDLKFRTGDRPVNLQDGNASAARARTGVVLVDREIELPCGVLRVAPLEESVEGVIAFPPSQWSGRPVEGLRLRFAKGRVVEVSASSGKDAVLAELKEGGPGSDMFREFALGFNPELAVPERGPWIAYYGYGAGVVRLSLGDNSELGGKVASGHVRWNFFSDLSVTVADTPWVKDGKLIVRK